MTQRKEGVLKRKKKITIYLEREREEEEEPRNKKECLTIEKSFQHYVRYVV